LAIVQTFWPADFKKVGARFGELSETRKKLGLGPHRGLDFTLPVGTPLKAIGNGSVVLVGESEVLGYRLEVRCFVVEDGKRVAKVFSYDHLKEPPKLKVGDKVKGGEVICLSGNSGSASSGPHLHLMAGDKVNLAVNPTQDPLPLIKSAIKPVEFGD
jgi:murein DD-endopeptidase